VRILCTDKGHCNCRLQRKVVRPLMDQNEVVGEWSPFRGQQYLRAWYGLIGCILFIPSTDGGRSCRR
jgi:hypothetical protein